MLLAMTGLFSNHGPLYFVSTKLSFSKMGLACHIAKIHSEVCYNIAVVVTVINYDNSNSYEARLL